MIVLDKSPIRGSLPLTMYAFAKSTCKRPCISSIVLSEAMCNLHSAASDLIQSGIQTSGRAKRRKVITPFGTDDQNAESEENQAERNNDDILSSVTRRKYCKRHRSFSSFHGDPFLNSL